MTDILDRIAECCELGKISKESAYPLSLRNQDGVVELIRDALASSVNLNDILSKGLLSGMSRITGKFMRNEVFVPDLFMAAKAMKAGVEELRPHFKSDAIKRKGTLIIGAVKGEQQDIGKNLVCLAMECAAYEVVDMGVDVSPEAFLAKLKERPGSVVGLSAYLSTTLDNMEETTRLIKSKMPETIVIIGGACVTQAFCDRIGADAYFREPFSAIEWLDKKVLFSARCAEKKRKELHNTIRKERLLRHLKTSHEWQNAAKEILKTVNIYDSTDTYELMYAILDSIRKSKEHKPYFSWMTPKGEDVDAIFQGVANIIGRSFPCSQAYLDLCHLMYDCSDSALSTEMKSLLAKLPEPALRELTSLPKKSEKEFALFVYSLLSQEKQVALRPYFEKRLVSGNRNERLVANDILMCIGYTEKGKEVLVKYLRGRCYGTELRIAACRGLTCSHPGLVLDFVLSEFQKVCDAEKKVLLEVLGGVEDQRAIDVLADAMRSKNSELCSCAIQSLGKNSSKRATVLLLELLQCSRTSQHKRLEAYKALAGRREHWVSEMIDRINNSYVGLKAHQDAS